MNVCIVNIFPSAALSKGTDTSGGNMVKHNAILTGIVVHIGSAVPTFLHVLSTA